MTNSQFLFQGSGQISTISLNIVIQLQSRNFLLLLSINIYLIIFYLKPVSSNGNTSFHKILTTIDRSINYVTEYVFSSIDNILTVQVTPSVIIRICNFSCNSISSWEIENHDIISLYFIKTL